MSYIGIPPFGQTVRSVTTATATSGQTTFNISGGYVVGYVDVYLNGLLLGPTAYTATNGTTVVLGTGATVGDKFQALAYQPVSFVDALKSSNNLSEVASASTARTNLGLGSIATQDANNVSITGGSVTGITDLAVADGGTGASSLTANNVILGNGTSPVQFVAPGTNGNVLTSNGTTWTSSTPAAAGVTSVSTGTGLTGGPITSTGTISLANTSVTPGSYTTADITVDAQGRITAAASGSAGGGVPTTGAVGSYAWLGSTNVTGTAAGNTKAGSSLRYAGIFVGSTYTLNVASGSMSASGNGGTPAGTWKAMGRDPSGISYNCSNTWYGATLWVRTV